MTGLNRFAAADMRRAYTLAAAYAERDTATMHAVWRQASEKSATIDLVSAVLAALFDTAPELRRRLSEMHAAAADFAAMEKTDESEIEGLGDDDSA